MNQARFKVTFGSSVVLGTLSLALTLAGCSSDDTNNNQNPATGSGGDTGTGGGGNTGGSHTGGAGGKGGTANGGAGGKGGAGTGGGGGTAGSGGAGTGGAGTGGAGTGGADTGDGGDAGCVPDAPSDPANVPSDVVVPSNTTLVYQVHATGTQDYTCTETPLAGDAGVKTYSWTFIGPEADLHDSCGVNVGTHYASAAGPTAPRWKSTDGSIVQGTKKKSSAVAGSIPVLLLQATEHEGSGVLSDVHFIQRLDTTGGAAPAADTCTSANVNEVQKVDYTANYYFYSGGPDGGI